EGKIDALNLSFQQKEQEHQNLIKNHAEYRILAGIHGFETISAPVAEELRDHSILREQLERGEKAVKTNKDRFETARMQFDLNVSGIPVASTFKDTIKQKLRVAESLKETRSNRKNMDDYSNTILVKVELTKSQIEPLKEVEKRVVDQALGMAMMYRDYLKKFPEISKIYIDERLKDMVRMNFDQCIYTEDQAKVEMRRYIQDLNRGIENGTVGLKELENYLRPNQLINRVMDMRMIRVKIRKIDRGSIDFQNWEAIKASDGQENTMYIIFIVILMSFIRDIVVGRHDKNTSKVMIIDNPFGSTGAFYLWEPIWSILERNNVQLICTGHKIGGKIREFFPFNHILTEDTSESGQIRIGIKVEAAGPARETMEEMQRGTLSHWIQPI
ncbi:hypothetical protein, partial [Methanocalculus sp.]|uniref:hypothetical protein n=1 Tax=Methanocalculus sp. TaxID=2004547 RepID=UPI002620358A